MYKCDLCVAMGEMGGIFIYNYIYIIFIYREDSGVNVTKVVVYHQVSH